MTLFLPFPPIIFLQPSQVPSIIFPDCVSQQALPTYDLCKTNTASGKVMLMHCNNFFNEKIYILYMFDRKGPSISSLSNIFIYSCQYLITCEETQDWRYSHRRSMAKHDLSRGLLPTRWSRFRVNDNIQAGKIFLQEQFINHEVHRGANMRCDAVNWQDNEEERRERANKEERPPNPSAIIAVEL